MTAVTHSLAASAALLLLLSVSCVGGYRDQPPPPRDPEPREAKADDTQALLDRTNALLERLKRDLPESEKTADDKPLSPPATEASPGWEAQEVWKSDTRGVWRVAAFDLLPRYPGSEIVALDDLGRAPVIYQDGGGFVAWQTVFDGQTGSALAFGDVDPRRDRPELYVGGFRGNVYQIVALPQGGFNQNVIWWAEDQVHTLCAARLLGRAAPELYAFTLRGLTVRLDPPAAPGAPWTPVEIARGPARVRDAVPFRFSPLDEADSLLTVSQDGALRLLRGPASPEAEAPASPAANGAAPANGGIAYRETVLFAGPQALARLAVGWTREGQVAYAVGDDGRLLRAALPDAPPAPGAEPAGAFDFQCVYYGPPGARGVAAGRFHADGREAVALFGYSKVVELVSRDEHDQWHAEPLFTDTDRGHWVVAAELDERNGTDELIVCGYSGRVTLLRRPAGYGADGPRK
ncbi:MAG: hypothetical protein HY719_02190 [Planctomycetes bacterium]|nr:hypothetical protein [Planctomycetota bacterium]